MLAPRLRRAYDRLQRADIARAERSVVPAIHVRPCRRPAGTRALGRAAWLGPLLLAGIGTE